MNKRLLRSLTSAVRKGHATDFIYKHADGRELDYDDLKAIAVELAYSIDTMGESALTAVGAVKDGIAEELNGRLSDGTTARVGEEQSDE